MPFLWQPYSTPPETHMKWRTGDGFRLWLARVPQRLLSSVPFQNQLSQEGVGTAEAGEGLQRYWTTGAALILQGTFRPLLWRGTNEQLQTLCLSTVCHLQGSAGWAPQRCCYCCVMWIWNTSLNIHSNLPLSLQHYIQWLGACLSPLCPKAIWVGHKWT